MKKTIKSLLAIAVAAFAFTACSDVPEPYAFPSSTSDTTDPNMGKKDTPYDVASAIKVAGKNGVYVKGFIVGYALYTEGVGNTFTFGTEGAQASNFLIAATPDETNSAKCMPVALPTGDVRNALNLKDHPENLKKEINLYGDITKYFGQTGIKEVSYAILDGKDIGTDPGEGGTPSTAAIEVTCAEAVTATNKLADGATSTETYAVTGYITEVVGSVSRNQQTFWIADTKDGGKVFEAYYADLPDGVTEFKKGMKVKITGNLIKYVNSSTGAVTPEIKNAKVEILESGDDTPADVISVTCAEAVTATNKLADGATSTETYAVTGYITTVVGNVSNNQQTFWMADTKDGGKVFEAYWANLPSGVSAFTVGMKVKITGNLIKYVKNGDVTPEIKNATVEILEGGGESGGESGGGSGEGGGSGAGMGTLDNPYTVAAAQTAGDKNGQYVQAYIVGFVNGASFETGATFSTENASASNIMIAASPDETDYKNCMPVQLPANTEVRTGVNLKDNPGNLKKEILLYGNLAAYFGSTRGVKAVSYAKIGTTEYGTKP